MHDTFELNFVQKLIRESKLAGWLFYDFQGMDPISLNILKVGPGSRRWFYYVPARGAPVKIVHAVDSFNLDHLPGQKRVYLGWRDLRKELKSVAGQKRLAVQFSIKNTLPDVSRIDAGTFELLRDLGVNPVSSANLVQILRSKWSEGQVNTHMNAAKELNEAIQKSLKWIKRKIGNHEEVTEWSVLNYLSKEMINRGLISDVYPRVATGQNSGIPFYMPSEKNHAPLLPGQIIQIYISGKEKSEQAVYATQAWVGFLGNKIPDHVSRVFKVLVDARDTAIQFTDDAMKSDKKITGFEVDQQIQNILVNAGYESYVLHRTGHSIGKDLVVEGVSIDSLEIHDERHIIPQTCFTLEPALYFSEYGMRISANVYVDVKNAGIKTASLQTEITQIL